MPASVRRLIARCLDRDVRRRLRDIGEARIVLEDPGAPVFGDAPAVATLAPQASVRSNRLAWLIAALSTIALIATVSIVVRRTSNVPLESNTTQFTILSPNNTSFGSPPGPGTGAATQVAVSPDGRTIAFVAGAQSAYQIWVRPVATLAATPIPGTEGGTFPFWSPDSRSLGFFAAGKLKKVAIAGGPPIELCDAFGGRGGSWSRDNVILFAPLRPAGLQRVSGAGGTPTVVAKLDPATGEDNYRWPHFLPDGQHFFYTAITGACCPAAKPSTIKIGSLDATGAAVTLLQAESPAFYASGHLFFARDDTLMAQPFDPEARQLTGDAFPVAEHVRPEGSRYVGASVSANGTLVYASDEGLASRQLTWFDRAGRALGTLGHAGPYNDIALSPDDSRVAISLETTSPENRDIWIIETARNMRTPITFDPGTEASPVWSPDGTHIAFEGQRSGKVSLRQLVVNGTGTDESLVEVVGTPSRPCDVRQCNILPSAWSADGRFIAYTFLGSFPQTADVWILPLFGDRKPFPLVQTKFLEGSGTFSPDGRWIAYTTGEPGEPNVYVQPFLRTGGKSRVSPDGGHQPVWRADGQELFYLAADGTMMTVPIDATAQFEAGAAQALFRTGVAAATFFRHHYAVTKDGQRFLVNAPSQQSGGAKLTVVVNWTAAIQK
jgi:Tol biopolymer transport system component